MKNPKNVAEPYGGIGLILMSNVTQTKSSEPHKVISNDR